MNEQIPNTMDALIAKYFFDELTQEEERQLLDWIAEKPENAEQFVHSKKLLNLAESENPLFQPNEDDAWANVQERLSEPSIGNNVVKRERSKVRIRSLASIATVVLVLIGLTYGGSLLNLVRDYEKGPGVVAATERNFDDIVEITTANDVKVIYLPDSSLVFLNRNSKLVYSKNFAGDYRNVFLEGESFFDVRPDADRPFCVYTANTKTRVLGTSFNISAYRESGKTAINVAHGKVVFFLEGTSRDRMMVLESKDKVVFNQDDVTLTKYRNIQNDDMAWIDDFETAIDEVEEVKINDGLLLSPYSKEVAHEREASAPDSYINNVSSWHNTYEWKNHLVKKTVIQGEIYSTAVAASFDNINLKATFYNSENQVIGAEVFVVKQVVRPGNIVEYKRKLDQYFDGTANVIVEIYHAQALDEM